MRQLTRPKLILAEDHPLFAKRFAALLKDDFEVVAVVEDGEKLDELVAQLKPDCVVSDIGLKGLDGIEATKRIRRRDPDIPIVLITAHDDPLLRTEGLAAGASAFMSKIDASQDLIAVLRQLLHWDSAT